MQAQSFAIFPLLSAILIFFLGLFTFLKNKKRSLNIVFSLVCLSLFIWLLGTFLMFMSAHNKQLAILLDRICYVGIVYISVLMYHFSVLFSKSKKQGLIIIVGYIIFSVFLVLAQTKYFVDGLFIYKWGVHSEAKILHHIFLIFFSFYLVLFFINLYRYYRTASKNTERQQAKYIFLAFFLLTFAAIEFLPAYKIPVYPLFYFLGVIATSIITYTIVQHRFMDIRIVVRQVTVYGVSFVASVGFSLFCMFLATRYLPFYISSPLIGSLILIAGIIIFQIVKERFGVFANHHLFYPLYSYEKTLGELSKELSTFIDLGRLVFVTSEKIKEVMKLDKIGLILKKISPPKGQLRFLEKSLNQDEKMLKMEGEDGFYLAKNIGFDAQEMTLLVKNNFFLQYLEKSRKPVVHDELEPLAEEVKDEHLKKKFLSLKKYMEKTGAAIYLPLSIEERLLGIFVLGRKVSGDAYSIQDLQLLETLSSQIAIAANNAQLYEQSQYFNQILRARIVEATKELSEAYRELKKLDDSKTEFLSLASHQLRTPLSAIKGYLSMVLEGSFGKLQKETEAAIRDVYESNERLIALVNDLLNITRIEAGKLEYKPIKTDLDKLIRSVVNELEVTAKKKNLILEHRIKNLPEVSIDPDKIRQVLINLIDNAIKYTSQGKVMVKTSLKDKGLVVEIKDTGIGIAKEKMARLFEWFSRGKGAIRLESGGFGLGLYIAKKIVEKAGGKIWAESPGENKGSTFAFFLPIK